MSSQREERSSSDPESQPFLQRRAEDDDEEEEDVLQKAGRKGFGDFKRPAIFFGGIFVTILVALLFDQFFVSVFKRPETNIHALSASVFDEGLRSCGKIERTKQNPTAFRTGGPPKNLAQRRNPRYSVLVNNTNVASTGNPILIKNAIVLDGVGGRFENVDVALAYGLVVKIAQNISVSDVLKAAETFTKPWDIQQTFQNSHVEVIDAEGRYVTPGIVDQHSHVGAESLPILQGSSDGNEMSSQTNPQNRIQDSISILDEAIDMIASGGVTTSLVLPGSGTLMGGEALAIKLLKPTSFEVEDMKVNRNAVEELDGKLWRWMKMACGENQKHSGVPTSRMGSGWLFRKRFEQARSTLNAQDDWCLSAQAAKSSFGANAHKYVTQRFPDPAEQESLVALLRGDVRVNVHCYETHDIEMMVRNKHEFGFEITAFHHAHEAYLVAPLLARENISVAIFADFSLYKKEGYGGSVHAGKILHKAGVKIAYKSDHPVLNAQHLIYEAQKAAQYGLDPDVAFAAVTSVPAERLGLGWRIGKLAVGYDADVLVWDRHPLDLGAKPLKVFIDGFLLRAGNRDITASKPPTFEPATPALSVPVAADGKPTSYTVTNVSRIFADDGDIKKGSVVVEKGVVTCVGTCKETGTNYNLNGGVIIPGLIGANLELGLVEIAAEEMTSDGTASVADAIAGDVRAVDGIRVGGNSKALNEAFRGGVLTSITVPFTNGFVKGLSAAFRTGAELYSEAILKPVVALHVDLGILSLSPLTSSISSQISKLRTLLTTSTTGPFREAFLGKLPLVVTAHDPNDISKVLSIKKDLAPELRLIIAGGAGAWAVASEIASLNVPVLLNPPRAVPLFWEARWSRVPGSEPSAVDILVEAGVKVLITQPGTGIKRNLIWEAGWIYADSKGKVSENDAVGSVTWNVAKAFGVDAGVVREGKRASFVGLNGGPLGFGKTIQIIGDGGDVVLKPEQE